MIKKTYLYDIPLNPSLREAEILKTVIANDREFLEKELWRMDAIVRNYACMSVEQQLAIQLWESEDPAKRDEAWWYEIDKGIHQWNAHLHGKYLIQARTMIAKWIKQYPGSTGEECLRAFNFFNKRDN